MYKDQATGISDDAAPLSDIDEQVMNLKRDCKILRDTIDHLEQRLRPVLREEMEGAEKDSELNTYIVPLADSLRDIDRSIQATQSRINSMTCRLGL